jgi:hypothetical protein
MFAGNARAYPSEASKAVTYRRVEHLTAALLGTAPAQAQPTNIRLGCKGLLSLASPSRNLGQSKVI